MLIPTSTQARLTMVDSICTGIAHLTAYQVWMGIAVLEMGESCDVVAMSLRP